jgi:hypothetical protein
MGDSPGASVGVAMLSDLDFKFGQPFEFLGETSHGYGVINLLDGNTIEVRSLALETKDGLKNQTKNAVFQNIGTKELLDFQEKIKIIRFLTAESEIAEAYLLGL